MAIDLARLSIEVDTTDLRAGKAELRGLAQEGQRTEAATKKLERGLQTAGTQARQYGMQVQGARMQTANIAAQFNDIGVMMASGQSPLMLAMQQGTQLNQVFAQMGSGRQVLAGLAAGFTSMINPLSLATIGIIAGGAALFQWGMSALGATDEAKKLAESLEEIKKNADEAEQSLRAAQFGVSQAELQVIDAIAAKQKEIQEAVEAVGRAGGRNVTTMEHQLSLRQEELAELEGQLETIRRAQLEAGLLRDGMSEAAIEALKIANMDLSKPIWDGARAAAQLAANLGISFQAASLRMLQQDELAAGVASYGQGREALRRLTETGFTLPKSKQGGGGKSEAQRQFEASQREAQRLLDGARTAAEKYADEIARVNELQQMGIFTGEEAAKVIDSIRDKYNEAGDAAKFWEETQRNFNEGLLDAIVNGRELSDVFQQLARSIAKAALEAAFFNTGPMAGGGGLGNILGGLFGGFRAEGGPVDSGRAYVVGERGPELFMPGQSGTIVPNGGGSTKVIVEASPYFDVRVQEVSGAVVQANNQQVARQQGAAKW